ncbi:MAG: ATP-grasp domain-containing protein [Proteobacteria bacterium]|jgi:hypothetical protein|nr:ATP-grasp domain-containing protein [Pseudomonadota bacterium]
MNKKTLFAEESTLHYLIEDDAFPEDVQPFIDAVKAQGFPHKIIKQIPCEKTEFLHLFPENTPVLFYGSLGLGKSIRKQANWVPGVYYDVPKYDCTSYYAALGKYLLQENYIMLPYAELLRQKEFLYEHVGCDRTIFMRPNRGDKIFTGKAVYKESYEKDVEYFGFNQIEPFELVVVSEPRNIQFEWRFVVVDGVVVAGSQYRENERFDVDATYPQEAVDFANLIASKYNPESVFVVDVCLTKSGQYRLMEVGCFSCAGLYACDRSKIIESVSAVALREWRDFWEG